MTKNKRKPGHLFLSLMLAAGITATGAASMMPSAAAYADELEKNIDTELSEDFRDSVTNCWHVISGDEDLAVLKTKKEAEMVAFGLKLAYYDTFEEQQEAEDIPAVTVEKKEATGAEKIKTVKEAVEDIKMQNLEAVEKDGVPVISIAYQKTEQKEKAVEYATVTMESYDVEEGETEVKQEGKKGKLSTISFTTYRNGEAEEDVISSDLKEKPQTEVIVKGKKIPDSKKGQAVIRFGQKYIGTPYLWGGEGLETGIDCSGFTMMCYRHFGISLPHQSQEQAAYGNKVDSLAHARPGDLLIFPGHVGMYMGHNMILHSTNGGVQESSLASGYADRITDIRRIFGSRDDTSINRDFKGFVTIDEKGIEDAEKESETVKPGEKTDIEEYLDSGAWKNE